MVIFELPYRFLLAQISWENFLINYLVTLKYNLYREFEEVMFDLIL